MEKANVVASLGQHRLMLPAWVKAALAANDRLKLYLTVLQAAVAHATHPEHEAPDLRREMATAQVDAPWLAELLNGARRVDEEVFMPRLQALRQALMDDLATMARPVLETASADSPLPARVQHWAEALAALPEDRLGSDTLSTLTHGGREGHDDSLHLLVMALHKAINQLAAGLASEVIDGAHVWELRPADRPRVAAFMRGLALTRGLKFDHPGLETAATRDGERLLIQNDIGTNDAHVLVIQVVGREISLTYSDLHPLRLAFFQGLLSPLGAQWTEARSLTDAGLNQGQAFQVSTARFACTDDDALDTALAGIGSRIVFLIDWNRARKRLQQLVGKRDALAILDEVATLNIGHRAWLQVGGERLVFAAMQAVGGGAFRIGDRLDEVMGESDAHAFLVSVMRLACEALQRHQPPALVADETRMLLARHVRQRSSEFDLLLEHAAYCQALAQAVSDGLAHDASRSAEAARALAQRAKTWERQADHLVMQARDKAERQARWRPVARLAEQTDDVADALEEAAFLIELSAAHHHGWNAAVREVLGRLADTVLQATQDQVKALAVARTLGSQSEAADNDAFLDATWQVLQAERQCDGLLREARRTILGAVQDPASLMLASGLAGTLEEASDRLLGAAYALRALAFEQAGSPA